MAWTALDELLDSASGKDAEKFRRHHHQIRDAETVRQESIRVTQKSYQTDSPADFQETVRAERKKRDNLKKTTEKAEKGVAGLLQSDKDAPSILKLMRSNDPKVHEGNGIPTTSPSFKSPRPSFSRDSLDIGGVGSGYSSRVYPVRPQRGRTKLKKVEVQKPKKGLALLLDKARVNKGRILAWGLGALAGFAAVNNYRSHEPTFSERMEKIGTVDSFQPFFKYDNRDGKNLTKLRLRKNGKDITIPVAYTADSIGNPNFTGTFTTSNAFKIARHTVKPTAVDNTAVITITSEDTYHSDKHKELLHPKYSQWHILRQNDRNINLRPVLDIDAILSAKYAGFDLNNNNNNNTASHLVLLETVRLNKTNENVLRIPISRGRKIDSIHIKSQAREWKIGINDNNPESSLTLRTGHPDYKKAVENFLIALEFQGPYSDFAGFTTESEGPMQTRVTAYAQKNGQPFKYGMSIPNSAFGTSHRAAKIQIDRPSETTTANVTLGYHERDRFVVLSAPAKTHYSREHNQQTQQAVLKDKAVVTLNYSRIVDTFSGKYHPISRVTQTDATSVGFENTFITIKYDSHQTAGVMHTEMGFEIASSGGFDDIRDALLQTETGVQELYLKHDLSDRGYIGSRIELRPLKK